MRDHIEELYMLDYDKKKIYSLVRSLLERSPLPIEDAYELEFLSKCAQSDFTHFLYTKMGLYTKISFDERKARIKLCRLLVSRESKVKRILQEWVDWWALKWRQRVRVIFDTERSDKQQQRTDLKLADDLLGGIPRDLSLYYKRLGIVALIEVGEVCSLDVVSDFLVKSTVMSLAGRAGQDKARSIVKYRPDLMKIELLKKAVEISRSSQPIVVLRVRVNAGNSGSS